MAKRTHGNGIGKAGVPITRADIDLPDPDQGLSPEPDQGKVARWTHEQADAEGAPQPLEPTVSADYRAVEGSITDGLDYDLPPAPAAGWPVAGQPRVNPVPTSLR